MSVSVFSKTVGELRDIARGEPITARMLNEPRRAINTMLRGVTPPRQILTPPRPGDAEPAITVVLVEAPSLPSIDPPVPGSSILKIRRVAYADPPVPEQYTWDGEAFDAYPAFGVKIADFVGLDWLATPAVPDVDRTTFLKARLVNGFWLVDRPPVLVAQFQLIPSQPVRANYVLAHLFDGETVGTQTIKIAKPYLLRESTFDEGQERDGKTYVVTGPGKRTATKVGTSPPQTEKQVIVERYFSGDLIYATAYAKGGTGVTSGAPPQPVLWLDNDQGRAWAAEFEEEAASA